MKDNAPTPAVYAEADEGSTPVLVAAAAPSFVVALLRRHGLLPAASDTVPAWFGDDDGTTSTDTLGPYEKRFAVVRRTDPLDGTGRLSTLAEARAAATGGSATGSATVPVQTYRIAKQRIEPDQDGSISFVIALAKTEWHGGDDGRNWEDVDANGRHGSRVLAAVENPGGYGEVEQRVVPSVPRENGIPTMRGIVAGAYEAVEQKRQTEGQEGSSDVSFSKRKLYDYLGGTVPGTGDPDGHTPAFANLDGNPFNACDYRYDPTANAYTLEWSFVDPKKTQELVDKVRGELGGEPVVSVRHHPGNYDIVRVVGKGRSAQHLEEWVVEADWFKHETVEQWIGVSLVRDPQTGVPTGFKYRPRIYTTSASGDTTVDWEATNDPLNPWQTVPFAAIRGDLDADWMGSDPQRTDGGANALPTTASHPTLYATTGRDQGGAGATAADGKLLLSGASEPSHGDAHGNGWVGVWNASKWIDPDGDRTLSTNGQISPPVSSDHEIADQKDKKRSHVLTKIERHLNEDGTYNIAIRRTYPHQRYWTWQTEAENADGETRVVRHFAFVNWPSRKAIQLDLFDQVKKVLSTLPEPAEGGPHVWDDGWSLSGGVQVNAFGLVNAGDITLTPSWSNRKAVVRHAQTITEYRAWEVLHPVRTTKCPKDQDEKKKPKNGFWERVDTWFYCAGYTTSAQEAENVLSGEFLTDHGMDFKGIYEGSRGVWPVNNRHGIASVWAWEIVYKIIPGSWSDGEGEGEGGGTSGGGTSGGSSGGSGGTSGG